MKCHAGIELIREPDSEMLRQIMERGREQGDPAGCIVCHNGDPTVTDDKEKAHGGEFYPAPGQPVGERKDMRTVPSRPRPRPVAQPHDDRGRKNTGNRLGLWFT